MTSEWAPVIAWCVAWLVGYWTGRLVERFKWIDKAGADQAKEACGGLYRVTREDQWR